jgi:hypothetical protein
MTQVELSRLENGLLANGVTYTTLSQLSHALQHKVVLQPTSTPEAASVPAVARVPRGGVAGRTRPSRARSTT